MVPSSRKRVDFARTEAHSSTFPRVGAASPEGCAPFCLSRQQTVVDDDDDILEPCQSHDDDDDDDDDDVDVFNLCSKIFPTFCVFERLLMI